MPNPEGGNQFTKFTKEPPLGQKGKMKQNMRAASLAGAQGSTSALEAPRRAKRHAVEGKPAPQQAPAGQDRPVDPQAAAFQPPADDVLPTDASVAAFWAEAASIPGVSKLALEYADEVLGVQSAL